MRGGIGISTRRLNGFCRLGIGNFIKKMGSFMIEIITHYATFFDAQGIDLALRCLAVGTIVSGLIVAFGAGRGLCGSDWRKTA